MVNIKHVVIGNIGYERLFFIFMVAIRQERAASYDQQQGNSL